MKPVDECQVNSPVTQTEAPKAGQGYSPSQRGDKSHASSLTIVLWASAETFSLFFPLLLLSKHLFQESTNPHLGIRALTVLILS